MGNKHGKTKDGDGKTKHPSLFDVNATGAEVYPIALKEKDPETQAELFRHAALCYRESNEHDSAAHCYVLAGETFVKIDDLTDAADMYQEAMLEYSLLGPTKYEVFKECADEALQLVSRSKYETRQRGYRDTIAQAILRMLEATTDERGLSLLIRSGLFTRYLKGDNFENGLRNGIKKLKEIKVQDMMVWALLFKSAVDYYVGLFVLDSSLDDELGTYTSCAIIAAYLYSLQPPPQKRKTSSINTTPKSPSQSSHNNSTGDNSDNEQHINNKPRRESHSAFYEQPPDYKQWIIEFRQIPVFKRVCHQLCHNIITACEAGDLNAIEEQFHELYFTRRKNKFKLLEFMSTIVLERFTVYIDKGFVKAGIWNEEINVLPEDKKDDDDDNTTTTDKDVVDDLL